MPWIALRPLPENEAIRASVRKRVFLDRLAFVGLLIPVLSLLGWWLSHLSSSYLYPAVFVILLVAFCAHIFGIAISIFAAVGGFRHRMAFIFAMAAAAFVVNFVFATIIFLLGAVLLSHQC